MLRVICIGIEEIYYVSTAGQSESEETIRKNVQEQGIKKDYKQIHYDEQPESH